MIFLYVFLILLSAIFWRMGGSNKYSKLYRRLGSSICMVGIVNSLYSIPLIFWGCSSYFGWINNFLNVKDKDREYWWNFFAENLVIQLSVLFNKNELKNVVFAIISALVIALIKTWMDKNLTRADVKSELWHGGSNALCLLINQLI